MAPDDVPHVSSAVPAPLGWAPFAEELMSSTVHGAFSAHAAARPEAEALSGPSRSLTYGEVDRETDTLAAGLSAHEVVGRPVGLLFSHDVDLVLGVIAVMKAGGIALILDPAAPPGALREVLDDSAPALIVVGPGQSGETLETSVPVVASADLRSGRADWVALTAGPDDPALLAYSSGTTGGPKGAVIPHGALLNLARGATDALRLVPSDRLPMLFPASMAVAAYPMLLPLMVGASLHAFDMRSEGLAPFPDFMVSARITVLYFSPTVARFVGEACGPTHSQDLRVVVLGGERVDDDAVDAVREVFGDGPSFLNGYGTTETGVLTFHLVGPGDRYGAAGVPVGRPIRGVALRLLRADGSEAAEGEVGELEVESPHLFQGYWGRPELDALVLSAGADGTARYRTGDLARLDGDLLSLVGRRDDEVKVRGHRVHPGEVEQMILHLDAVHDAVVDARPDPMGTHALVAWVVPADGFTLDEVRKAVEAELAAPLVPAHLLEVEALPLLPNGKLDRRALPEPEGAEASPGRAPRSDLESDLLDIWEAVLRGRRVGLDRDLVAEGVHSLDAAWALVLVEEQTGVRVPMSAYLEARTIAQLATIIGERRTQLDAVGAVEVQRGDPGRPRLFVTHDLHGSAYGLRHLAPALGADQPVWGFESPMLAGPKTHFTRLETLALRYITDMREVQPEGPYHLAGYSFGGVLAYEMARQLTAAGETVAFLGVMDVGPGYRGRHYDPAKVLDKPWMRIPQPPSKDLPLAERARWYAAFARTAPRDFAYHASMRTGLDRWLDPLVFKVDLARHGEISPGRRLWYAWRTHWELARRYDWTGRDLPGPLHLLWAEESAASDGTMGWGAVVSGPLTITHVPVAHEVFLQPEGVAVIGPALRSALDSALAAGASDG